MPGDRLSLAVVGLGPVADHLVTWLSADGWTVTDPSAADALVIVANAGRFQDVVSAGPEKRQSRLVELITTALADHDPAVPYRHVLLIGSAMVCGAWPQRPAIVDDDPISAAGEEGLSGDLVVAERTVAQWAASAEGAAAIVTYLRPAPMIGPDVDSMFTRHFEAPRLLSVRGVVRQWQFVHVSDVAAAVATCIRDGLAGALVVGAVRVGGDGSVVPDAEPPEVVAALLSMSPLDMPVSAAFSTAERLHKVGVLPAPASDLPYVVYPWTVDPVTLVAHGWRSQVSTAECLREVAVQTRGTVGLAGRRFTGMSAAAVGAAGAAVAIVGTAAMLRQARGRR